MIIQLMMKITSQAIRHPPSSSSLSLFSIFVIYFPLNRHSSCALFFTIRFFHSDGTCRRTQEGMQSQPAKNDPSSLSCLFAKLIVAFFLCSFSNGVQVVALYPFQAIESGDISLEKVNDRFYFVFYSNEKNAVFPVPIIFPLEFCFIEVRTIR